jgi:4-hydroxyphenylacetate 3-monooxygenase
MADKGKVKTGADHLAALRDGREVYIDGDRVADVTTHPAFRNAVHAAAGLYDYQARPENLEQMTFSPPPGAGYARINRCWQLPRSHAELIERRKALSEWAAQSCGYLGRAPDHVASSLLGQVIGIDVFRRHGKARAKALLDHFDHVSRHDCYVSYVIINPQADRDKAWGEQEDDLGARLVDEDRARRQDAWYRGDHGERAACRQPAAAASGRGRPRDLVRGATRHQGTEAPLAQVVRGARGFAARQPALLAL